MTTILTVTQINTYLKSIIQQDFNLQNIYVSGEISNFTNHYKSGHWYFTLKDNNSTIKAVMFSGATSRVRFEVHNGLKVLIRCSVSVYERDGVYQLYCEDMIPEGVGELTLAFEQLKDKLSKKGFFDSEHKKELPAFPKRIGVVTSSSGAALHDIINVISRRYPCGEIVFEPVQVQGVFAADDIARAIERFNLYKGCDVIIVGRGGGSIEDLWAFNEEVVAMAIYNSEIPVISAVGHETDFTIADFVADMRAPTPSAAAEIAVPDYREVLFYLDKMLDSLVSGVMDKLSLHEQTVADFNSRISASSPEKGIELYSQLLSACEEKINITFKNKVDFYSNALLHYTSQIEALSPLKLLAKGYSVVENENGIPVKSVSAVSVGECVNVKMQDGTLTCKIEEINN